jgi:hypothetical protein
VTAAISGDDGGQKAGFADQHIHLFFYSGFFFSAVSVR